MLSPVIIAIVLAVLIGIAGVRFRSRPLGLWSAVWLGYAAYEWLMYRRVLCSGECNIRVDLLLLYPFLVLGSLIVGRAVYLSRKTHT